MKRYICHMILCCGLCIATTDIAAQIRWESLDGARQRKTLASRSIHESVRMLCDADCDCDERIVSEALAQMTPRCKDRNRAALYICLYDRLHEYRLTDAATSVLMLQHYAEPLLVRLRDDDGRSIYRWAYTIARHYRHNGGAEAFDDDLRHALGRRAKRYAGTCRSLSECVRTALTSFETSGKTSLDMTEPRRSATGFVAVARDDFAAETDTALPLPMPTDSLPLTRGMSDELLRRDGVCCMPCDTPWQGVEYALCRTESGDCIVLTGSDRMGVTLPLPVEFTSTGMIFSVGRGGVTAAVISSDATVEQIGFAALPEGRLLQMKCNDEAVSVEIDTPHGRCCYQWLPSR